MVLNNIAFVASVTSRSQAYLQAMVRAEIFPEYCIVYADSREEVFGQIGDANKYFDLSEPLVNTLKKNNIPYTLVMNRDINSAAMFDAIKDLKQDYIIYSGYGGYILKKELFEIGKKYLHIHAGILPQYRGSTTASYSMIEDGSIGATVLFLNDKIDEGDIVFQEKYNLPEEKIDYIFEPWVRAQTLVHLLQKYSKDKSFCVYPQAEDNSEIYYVIHPVLKHLALLKAEMMQKVAK